MYEKLQLKGLNNKADITRNRLIYKTISQQGKTKKPV